MTAQIPDIIELDGASHALCSNPLEQYFELHPPRPQLPPPSTACWRGYVARWRIENGRLFLVKIHSGRPDDDLPPSGGPTMCLRLPPSGQSPADAIGWLHLSLPVVADWFTGELRVPQGEMVEYHHAGYLSVFEAERVLLVEQGVITEDKVVRLPDDVLADFRAGQEQWRAEQEQKERRSAEYQRIRRHLADALSRHWPVGCGVEPALLIHLHSETTMLGFIETLFEEDGSIDRLVSGGARLVEWTGDLAMDLSEEPPEHLPEARDAYAKLVRRAQIQHRIEEEEEADRDSLRERIEASLKTDLLALFNEFRRILSEYHAAHGVAE